MVGITKKSRDAPTAQKLLRKDTMNRNRNRQRSWVRWPFAPTFNSLYAAQTHIATGWMWPLTTNSVVASQRKRRHK